MKLWLTLFTAATLLIAVSSPAHAAGKGKGKNKPAEPGAVLSRFDRNKDGSIDSQEATRVNGLYASLYALDKNHDGQISSDELAGVKVPPAPAGGRGKKKAQ